MIFGKVANGGGNLAKRRRPTEKQTEILEQNKTNNRHLENIEMAVLIRFGNCFYAIPFFFLIKITTTTAPAISATLMVEIKIQTMAGVLFWISITAYLEKWSVSNVIVPSSFTVVLHS